MIALDTNVLVRFLTQDDPRQGQLASELFETLSEERPGFVCREVLIELVWVLERSYRLNRSQIARVLEGLLASSELLVEEADDVGSVLDFFEAEGFGFSDLMISQAAQRIGAERLVTFDRKAAQLDGVTLLSNPT